MRTSASHIAWGSTALTFVSLFLLTGCGGSSHTSNADACRPVVADLHKVATAFGTISRKPKEFVAGEPALGRALTADVKNVGDGDLKPAIADFVQHLDSVAKVLKNGKPPSSTDAKAFGTDAQRIDTVCRAAGVPSTTK